MALGHPQVKVQSRSAFHCLFACTRFTLPSVRLVLCILAGTSCAGYSCLSRALCIVSPSGNQWPCCSVLATVASATLVAERANERASIHGLRAFGFPRFISVFPLSLSRARATTDKRETERQRNSDDKRKRQRHTPNNTNTEHTPEHTPEHTTSTRHALDSP